MAAAEAGPRIFISYRRDDVPGQVGRLFGRLAEHYGEEFVFMDVESIHLAEDFESVIRQRITGCDIVLLAIGPNWKPQRPTAEGEKDYLHMEIEQAIQAKRRIGPLLIDRRELPHHDDLPNELRAAVRPNQTHEIRHSTFDRDVDALIAHLEKRGIRPPASHARTRIESALIAGGPPYSWFGNILRAFTPLGALGLGLAIATGAAWWAGTSLSSAAYNAGFIAGELRATEGYEERIIKERRESLSITGVVTDSGGPVEGAVVTLTNRRNQMKDADTTDSRGVYNLNLERLEIAERDIVRFEVTKPPYRPTVETVEYNEGFKEFRIFLRK